MQIQQAKKGKEPDYRLVIERGPPKRREFVIEVRRAAQHVFFHVRLRCLMFVILAGQGQRPRGAGSGSQQEACEAERLGEDVGVDGLHETDASTEQARHPHRLARCEREEGALLRPRWRPSNRCPRYDLK